MHAMNAMKPTINSKKRPFYTTLYSFTRKSVNTKLKRGNLENSHKFILETKLHTKIPECLLTYLKLIYKNSSHLETIWSPKINSQLTAPLYST